MRRVVNIAHRGACSLAPENTLAAARKARAIGADLWETDIAVTRDDELVLLHDDLLTRTTDVRKVYPDRAHQDFTTFTLSEIRALDAGSWFNSDDPRGQIAAGTVPQDDQSSYCGQRVPTLREALAHTQEAGWRVNLELKRQPEGKADFPLAHAVLDLIEEMSIDARHVVISSARHDWLREARARRPDIPVEALIGVLPSDEMDFGTKDFRTYNVRVTRTDPEQVRQLIDEGHEVNLYVVNEVDEMRRYIDVGVTGLITDFPQRLEALLP